MTDKYGDEEWYSLITRKYKLSADDMDEYISSFNYINNGGVITPSSLYDFIVDETSKECITIKDCRKIINKINIIACGKSKNSLDLQTYLLYMIPVFNKNDCVVEKINLKELFDSLDKDRDNAITKNEMYGILEKLNKNLTKQQLNIFNKNVDLIFDNADTNNDGHLSYNEFRDFFISNILNNKQN